MTESWPPSKPFFDDAYDTATSIQSEIITPPFRSISLNACAHPTQRNCGIVVRAHSTQTTTNHLEVVSPLRKQPHQTDNPQPSSLSSSHSFLCAHAVQSSPPPLIVKSSINTGPSLLFPLINRRRSNKLCNVACLRKSEEKVTQKDMM